MFSMSKAFKGKAATTEKKPTAAAKKRLVEVTLKMEPGERHKLEQLGGEQWVREQIHAARDPKSPF